jgi:hypothetical protein
VVLLRSQQEDAPGGGRGRSQRLFGRDELCFVFQWQRDSGRGEKRVGLGAQGLDKEFLLYLKKKYPRGEG